MGEKKLTPLKRFSNFTDNWKPISIKEIGDSYRGGGTPKTTKEDYWNGDIPWIQSSDLNEGDFFLGAARKQITELGLMNSATKLIKKNSLAIVTRVGVGKLSLIPFEYTTSQDFLSISDLNIDKHFAIYVLFKKLQEESKSLQGTSIKGITSGELLSKEVIIPSNSLEQQKIGQFFKILDERIANQERKIAKVKALKAAYLTEMFPQEGETVPKRRFKGFEDDWRQFELAKLTDLYVGKSFTSSIESNGKYIVMDMGSVSQEGNRLIHKKTNLKRNILLKEDLVMPKDDIGGGHIIGKTAYINQNNRYVLGDHVYGLRFQNNYGLFMHYCINSKPINKNIRRKATGSAQLGIGGVNVLNTIVVLPSLEEQQKIGEFFKNLDNQIET